LNTETADPRWFAHWWAAQRDRGDHIGCYADEVYAEGVIPLHPTPLLDIVDGLPEFFADLIEDAWFEWEDKTRQESLGLGIRRESTQLPVPGGGGTRAKPSDLTAPTRG